MAKKRSKQRDGISVKDLLLEVRQDVKQVREHDIPKLQAGFAVIKSETSTAAKIISAVGGVIAVVVSLAATYLK